MIEACFDLYASDMGQMYKLVGDVDDRALLIAGPDRFFRADDGRILTSVILSFKSERSYNAFTDWLYAWADGEAEVVYIRVYDANGNLLRDHL